MRITRLLLIGLFSLLTALVLTVPAQATAAATGKYVALGDSYASGLGSGSYTSSSGDCKRSTLAYAQLWANSHAPSAFSFVACSGAQTADVLNNQLGSVTSDTALVTVEIGGNDAGFSDVMITCNTSSDSTCVQRNNDAQNFARTTLPARLDNVYDAIRSRAPSAQVIVVGYPHMYRVGGGCIAGLSDTKRSAINQSADVLTQVVSGRAGAHGFRFLDGRSAFNGHEICAARPFWLHSVNFSNLSESYHPTADGQNLGYFAALRGITG